MRDKPARRHRAPGRLRGCVPAGYVRAVRGVRAVAFREKAQTYTADFTNVTRAGERRLRPHRRRRGRQGEEDRRFDAGHHGAGRVHRRRLGGADRGQPGPSSATTTSSAAAIWRWRRARAAPRSSTRATPSRWPGPSPALDLDALIGGFRPLFRALDPDQVNALSGQLITALQGQGGTINSFLSQTAALTNTLADRDQLIGQVIVNLNTVLGSLGDQSDQFAKAVDALAELVKGLESRKTGHQPTAWPTPTPPQAASPTCWRRPGRRCEDDPRNRPRRRHRRRRPRLLRQPAQHPARRVSSACAARHLRRLLQLLPVRRRAQAQRQGRPAGVRQGRGSEHGEVRAEMKPFAERNPFVIGPSGSRVTVAIVVGALQLRQAAVPQPGQGVLGLLRRGWRLMADAAVQVSGFQVGKVESHRARRAAGAGEVHRRQEHPARRSHRGGHQDQEPAGHQVPRGHPARRRPPGRHDPAGPHHVAVPAARRPRRSGDHDQRAEHRPAVGFAAGACRRRSPTPRPS